LVVAAIALVFAAFFIPHKRLWEMLAATAGELMILVIALLSQGEPSTRVSLGLVAAAVIIGANILRYRGTQDEAKDRARLQTTVETHGAVLDAFTRHDIRRRTRDLAGRIDRLVAPFMARIDKAADAIEADDDFKYVEATSELQAEMDTILERCAFEFIGETRDLILQYHAILKYNNDEMREIAAMTRKLAESRKDCTVNDVVWLARCLYALARTVPWQ
jgi:hypothetical protein